MNTATQSATPAPAPTPKGCTLPCPRCGEAGASITLDLDNLHGVEALSCRECDASFGVDEIRDIIARWTPILAWMDSFPVSREE